MNTKKSIYSSCLAVALAFALHQASAATTYTWSGGDTGGNWSESSNWNPSGVPAAGGDVAVLGDVTSGTRIIVRDSPSGGWVSTIQFNQSTAGAVNLLQVSTALTVSNAIDLSAEAGTEKISVDNGITLTMNGGITLGTNGELALQGTATVSGNGSVTVSGGTVTVAAVTGSGSVSSTFSSAFNMSSGSIVIENTGSGIITDRRLAFNGNVNITGGSISTTHAGAAGGVFFNGETNVINLDTAWDTGLALYLGRNGDQSLATNQTFAGSALTLRGHGVKTINSSTGTISKIGFMDGVDGDQGTTLKLDSDLALASGAAQPVAANWGQTGGTLQFGIDTNGHTLDLSAGASSGKWTPNRGTGSTSAQWTLSNSGAADGGSIKANAFDFSAESVTVNVGSGLVLTAVGGAGTSSNLGSAGSFDSAAKFVYAGNATSANAATLSSGRTIGVLQVDSGYLQTTGASFTAAGGIAVKAGATLDLATTAVSGPSITLGLDGANAGQIVAGSYTYSGDLSLDFASSAVAGTYTLFDFSGTVTSGLASVALTGLYGLALSGDSGVWTGTTGGYDFTFTEATGSLAIAASAVPEPTTVALLIGAVTFAACATRRRFRA